ncbi:MAG: oligosaccharide flippase family protein [Gaiellaceae bacterium]
MTLARQVWRSTAWTAFGSQTVAAFSLATSIMIARALAPHELGRYALVAAIVAITTSAGSLQMNGFCIIVDELTPGLLRSSLGIELTAGVTAFVVINAGAAVYGATAQDFTFAGLLSLASVVLLTNPFGVIASKCNRELAYGMTTCAQIAAQLVGAVAKVVLALAGFGAWGLVIGDVLISAVFASIMLVRIPDGRGIALDRTATRAQLAFGIPSLLTGVLSTAAQRGQDIVVAVALGTRQLGFFYLAARLSGQVYQLGRSLTLALLPAFSRARDSDLRRRYVAVTRLSAFFVGIPLAVLLVGASDLVSAIFGRRWIPAAVPLVLLFAAVAVRFVFWHVGNLLKARGRVREMTVLTAIQLVLVLGGSYSGARVGGLVGLAAVALTVELVLTLPKLALIRSVIPFSPWGALRAPLVTALACSAVGAAIFAALPGTPGLLVAAAAIAVIGLLGLWLSEASSVLVAVSALRRNADAL